MPLVEWIDNAEEKSPEWGDYGKSVAAGVSDVQGMYRAAGRYLAEKAGDKDSERYYRAGEKLSDMDSEDAVAGMSEAGRKRIGATITSEDFWKHPLSATALKATRQTPSMAAAMIPAVLLPGIGGATAGAALMGGAMTSAQTLGDIYKLVDDAPEGTLQTIPYYAALRSMGMSEEDARRDYGEMIRGNKPLIAFALGAVTNAFGPAAGAARALKGGAAAVSGAGRGVMGRVGAAVGEGALSEGIEEGAQNVLVQRAGIEGGLQDKFNYRQLADSAGEGALLGGVMSASGGLAGGRKAPRIVPKDNVEVVGPGAPSAEQTLAITSNAAPAPEQVTPGVTTQETPNVSAPAEVPVGAPVEAPVATPASEVPAPVAEAARRTRQPVAEPTEVAPVATPEVPTEVPSDVSAAAERVAEPTPAVETPAVADTAPRAPRILRPTDEVEKAAERLSKAAQDAAKPQLVEPKVSKGKNYTQAEIEQREKDATGSKTIFDELAGLVTKIPATEVERQALRNHLLTILKRAEDVGIKIPARASGDGTSDHLMWLREVQTLAKAMDKKGFVGKRASEHMTAFLGREKAAKGGDFSVMRSERKVEGDLAKRRSQGDVETMTAAGPDAETDQVVTAAPQSAKGAVRGVAAETEVAEVKLKTGKTEKVERAVAASKVKKIAITAEERAKYETPVTPKVIAPKLQEVKARVEAAAKKVETKPTEAQKESGNYTKGHVTVHGLDITIETPRGAERSGKSPDGKEWKVKLPDHYGYVKRTTGADGDQVDVYVGPHPDSKHVFVIDQQDLATGKFDEHKVVLGQRDAVSALNTYEKGFSDGKGLDRVQKITPMSVDEFKEWLANGDTKAPAADLEIDAGPTQVSGRPTIPVRATTGVSLEVEPLHTTTAARALASLDFSALRGIPRALAPIVRKTLMDKIGSIPVHVVADPDVARVFGRDPLQADKIPSGYYDPNAHYVAITHKTLKDKTYTAHVVLHEGIHAVTSRTIQTDPSARMAVRALMDQTLDYLQGKVPLHSDYAFTNEQEFIAEAFSNPDFQNLLAKIEISPALAKALKFDKASPSVWTALVDSIRKWLGLPDGAYTMLEAAIRVGEKLIETQERRAPQSAAQLDAGPSLRQMAGDIKETFTRAGQQEQKSLTKAISVVPNNALASIAERFFGPNNPVQKWHDARESRGVKAGKLLRETEPIVIEAAALEKKHQGPVWEHFTEFIHDETNSGVFGDRDLASQPHLKSDTAEHLIAKAKHADLAARFAKIPADLRALRTKGTAFFTERQNQMSFALLKNRLLLEGVDDEAMARRIFDGKETDKDVEAVGGARSMDLIKEAKELKKLVGPYYPLMRHGGYIVSGRYKVTLPGNARDVTGDSSSPVYEFKTKDELVAWVTGAGKDFHVEPRSVYVDKTTGLTYGVEADGKEVRITSQDVVAEQRWRATVQDKHLDMFETKGEALRAAHDLHTSGLFTEAPLVAEKRYEPGGRTPDILSGQLRSFTQGVKKAKTYGSLSDAQKADFVRAHMEASIRLLGSTRIQSKRLPRTYVKGASKDFTRVLWDYAQSSSAYLAKLEYAPSIEDARREARDESRNDYAKDSSLGRSSIANEMDRRDAADNVWENSTWHAAAQRLMAVSFIDKLASPSYSVINSMQVAMVAVPVVAARHGVARAVTEVGRAYNDVSGFSIVKQGLKETYRKARGDTSSVAYGEAGKNITPGERRMFQALEDIGTIGADTGLEIPSLLRARGGDTVTSKVAAKADSVLGYVESIVRQMPSAIEAINRKVTALAAYRLELAHTNDEAKATAYARKTVDETQFNYSNTNMAPLFNHPLAKLSFQFKKYGAAIYYLLGSNVGKAYRNEKPGDRAEALKTLGMIATTHMVAAGALGLPTEPFKYLLMGAKAAGLTALGWDDVEEIVRKQAAELVGKNVGEILTKGVPRALGLDISGRVGMDNLIAGFGTPKTDREADVKKWLFDQLVGAPGALIGDYVKGANELWRGEFSKAAEHMVNLKVASDAIRAYRQGTEGKKSDSGRQLAEPYTYGEAALRTFGFTPAREAEEGAKAAAFRSQSTKSKTQRDEVVAAWVNAKGADKVKAQRAVQEFNKTADKEARILPKDLAGAQKRKSNEQTGISTNKRTQPILDRLEQVYN